MNIYADVVCDIFHSGHVRFFEAIKNMYPNSRLIVGVMSDEQCKVYKRRPVYDIKDRCFILSSIRYVDKVIENAEMPITKEFMIRNEIDMVIHGDDISEENQNYWYHEPIRLGKYKTLPYTKHISTTKIIERIRLLND